MEIAIYILCIAAGLTCSGLATLRSMHMFQLNSYSAVTHIRWMAAHMGKHWSHLLALLLAVLSCLLGGTAFHLVLLLLFVLFAFLSLPAKKAKKPLVYTSRVKRMLATIALLVVCAALLTGWLAAAHGYLALCLLYGLSPLLPLLANLLNAPAEAAVRQYYISDAKKLLKSCPDLTIIGITGSYGKTSVKYYLTTLLKGKYNVLMTPESFNTPMGIVKTIREQLRSTHEIFVCEMGAKYTKEIKELCDIVAPRHGIITSIGQQHLETFKTVENIVKTKFELADAVAGRGMLFLNGDNALIREHLPHQEYQTYGVGENNDFRACDIHVTQNGTEFALCYQGERIEQLQTQLIGEHNVVNLVGAIAMSHYLGVSFEVIRTQMKKLTSPPHRLQLTKQNGMTIIDDAYNSNPNGCKAALATLALFDGTKILITPGMVELGAQQDACNYTFGEQAAAVCDFVLLVGEKQTKAIYSGLEHQGYDPAKIFVADSFKEAIGKAYGLQSEQQKIILLENDLPDNY